MYKDEIISSNKRSSVISWGRYLRQWLKQAAPFKTDSDVYSKFKDHFYRKDRIKSGSMLSWFIRMLSTKANRLLRTFYWLPIAIDAYGTLRYYAIV